MIEKVQKRPADYARSATRIASNLTPRNLPLSVIGASQTRTVLSSRGCRRTLAIRTELRGKNFAVMAHRTRHGNGPARLSIFVIRGVTDAEHPPISDCLSG